MNKKQTKKRFCRILCSIFMVIFCIQSIGCAPEIQKIEEKKPTAVRSMAAGGKADVWFAPGTQKIRPDVDKNDYADISTGKLSIKTGKSEYESAQIIISAKSDVSSYNLTLDDLRLTTDSSVIYPKESITVYNQSYVPCESIFEGSPGSTQGLYPDALIPFESAAEYGENTVKAGKNQGLWITFDTGKDVKAGTYEGEFVLSLDGNDVKIPVSVKVWDFDFAKNYTAKSQFLTIFTSTSYAELDSSQDILDAYAEALLDYRLNPGLLTWGIDYADPDEMEWYCQKAFDFAQDERVTNVNMPFALTYGSGTRLEPNVTQGYLRRFVELSFESFGTDKQLNIVSKLMSYFTFCDEPTLNTVVLDRVKPACDTFAELKKSLKAELLTELNRQKNTLSKVEYDFRLEVINDIDTVYPIITGPHDTRLSGVDCYCPYVTSYDSEKARKEYQNDAERWWYTAVGPHYPYPNYHIDDLNFLAPRLMSWMQAEYNVVGNLYWICNSYEYYPTNDFLEDPFNDTALRYPNANGDGYLFYPGKKYGINGPVGTIRLQAIRDGMEEYETLVALNKIYAAIDDKLGNGNNLYDVRVNFDDIYSRIKENLYDGVAVYTTQKIFDDARDLMATIAELANAGGVISSIDVTETAIKVQAVLPKTLAAEYDGRMKKVSLDGEYDLYTFSQPIDGTYNEFVCKIKNGETELEIAIPFGGEIRTVSVEKILGGVKIGSRSYAQVDESALIDASTVTSSGMSGKWLRLDLPDADVQYKHGFIIEDRALLDNIGASTSKLVLKMWSDRDPLAEWSGAVNYTVAFKYENDTFYNEVRSADLIVGWNEIVIGNIYSYDWARLGKLVSIRVYIGDRGSAAESDIYLCGFDVYMR